MIRRVAIRLWPRGVVGQLMLATALALLAAQLLNLYLINAGQRREQAAEVSARVAGAIVMTAEAAQQGGRPGVPAVTAGGDRLMPRHPPDVDHPPGMPHPLHRAALLGHGRVRFTDQAPASVPRDAWPAVSQRVARLLGETDLAVREVRAARVAGSDRRIVVRRLRGPVTRNASAVDVAVHRADGRWQTVRVFVAQRPYRLHLLLLQTAILYLLLLVPILWIGWRTARPLGRLGRAMAEPVGLAAPRAVAVSGPGDVRDLIDGFNAMRGRIAALLADKDRMLGAIGHDLRTPLASLRVRAEAVADPDLRARMVASITDMARMLEDIVTLARIGRSPEPRAPTDLAALVDAVAADYQELGADVTAAECGRVVATVRAGPLRRALRNLIDNALAYGRRAMLGIVVDADTIAIVVRDDGPGIPPDRIAALTEAFARHESSRNRATGGAGLGLAIAKGIVEDDGGRLVLVNRAEGGLEARIELPLADPA